MLRTLLAILLLTSAAAASDPPLDKSELFLKAKARVTAEQAPRPKEFPKTEVQFARAEGETTSVNTVRMPDATMAVADVSPTTPKKLTLDLLYYVDSDVELLVLPSPIGMVNIVKETGPLKARGKFIDNPTKIATKTYAGKFLYQIEAAKTGRCEILIVPVGTNDEAKVIRRTLDVSAGEGPQPPPVPIDPVTPATSDAPIAGPGFKALIVYDKTAVISAGQQSAIDGKTVRDYLESHCAKEGSGKAYRIWPVQEDFTGAPAVWQDAMKRPHPNIPWLVVSDGKTGFEGPLPKTIAETMTIFKKYGGE